MCDRVAVMYLGRIVELAGASRIYSAPLHPYTEALLSAIPIPDPSKRKKRILLQGDVASPIHPPSGCHFHPRCSRKMALCADVAPELQLAGPDHRVACHLLFSEREGQAAGSLL